MTDWKRHFENKRSDLKKKSKSSNKFPKKGVENKENNRSK